MEASVSPHRTRCQCPQGDLKHKAGWLKALFVFGMRIFIRRYFVSMQNRSALQNSIKFVFPPKTVLAACYYNITEFIAEDYHRSASAHLPQGKRDTKNILMVPCLSPASHPSCPWSREDLYRGGKPASLTQKVIYSFFPKAALRAGHNSVLGQVCSLISARGNLSRSGDGKKIRHSFTTTAPSVVKTVPGTLKKPQTQQNLGG